ncbi:hypothetical protein DYB37_010744 [Aphanomyces astaci]|uniref:Transmembrane protein n=1 Tax=Aphanomyces astaci TaxID=112090 RepID=A0A3R7B574_APHAT|nr:hypothetical protein DYB35_010455 [Aphanomyces astaci]RHZ28320.1 hypothetical protein DYB37_010744 [Aphanomyces astaci]
MTDAPQTPTDTHAYTKTDSSTNATISPFKREPSPDCEPDNTTPHNTAKPQECPPPAAATCVRRFGRWYVGDKGTTGKRYCGARISRGPFIWLHVVGVFVVVALIVIPIFTAVVVPKMIQAKFDEAIRLNPFNKVDRSAPSSIPPTSPSSASSSMPSSFEVLPDGSAADFRFNLTLGPLMSIGGMLENHNTSRLSSCVDDVSVGTVELVGPTTFYIADMDEHEWAAVTILHSVSFPVSSVTHLSILGNFSVFDTPSQACIDAIFPTKTIALVIHTQWTISFWGFNWYRNLPLHSRYDMPLSTTLQEQFDHVMQHPFASSSSPKGASSLPPSPSLNNQSVAGEPTTATTFEYFSKGTLPWNFRINTTIANLTVLPGIVEIVGPTVFAISDVKGKGWANVTFDSVSFPLHKTTRLSVYGNFSIYSLPTPSVVSAIVATNQFVMVVHTWWTIKAFGNVWFPKLQLQSHFDLNSDTGAQLWSSIKCRIYTC